MDGANIAADGVGALDTAANGAFTVTAASRHKHDGKLSEEHFAAATRPSSSLRPLVLVDFDVAYFPTPVHLAFFCKFLQGFFGEGPVRAFSIRLSYVPDLERGKRIIERRPR
jgi:hypothetical protein